jgi:hypothetical protein
MDWPGRSVKSRIAWVWMRFARRRAIGVGEPRPRGGGPDRIERLHSLGREDGRSPLYVITVMDHDGHVLEVAACDPDEYAESR